MCESVSSGQGDNAWTNLENARLSDDSYVTVVDVPKNEASDYLVARGFGFQIPPGSQINGVLVEVERHADGPSNNMDDWVIRLWDRVQLVGEDKAGFAPWSDPDDEIVTYGGSLDTWGLSLSRDLVTSGEFGVVISVQTGIGTGAVSGFIDRIAMTIYYTPKIPWKGGVVRRMERVQS